MADIGDYPDDFRLALLARTRHVWVTPTLVGLNIAVLAAMTATGIDPWAPKMDHLLRWGADYAPYTTHGQWWRLLACTFLHDGAPHLAANMTVLLQLGFLVERLFGSRAFCVVYFLAGLCGSLASVAWNPYGVSVGASGAIFGVFGLLVAFWARYRGTIPLQVLRPLQRSGAVFIALNVLMVFALKRIDVAAHLGGMVAGVLAGLLLARPLGATAGTSPLRREVLLFIVAAALVGGALATFPRAFDLRGELENFAPAQRRRMEVYNKAAMARLENKLSDSDMATIIEREMLPPLRVHRQRLTGLRRVPPSQRDMIQKRMRYVELRERAWSLLSEALHKQDRAIGAEALEVHDAADDLLESYEVPPKNPRRHRRLPW